MKIRLVAGSGSDSVTVRVKGAAPRLILLRAPARVTRRARAIKLRVAANQAGILKASGRRYAVDRQARRIKLRIAPGRKPLQLRLKLTARAGRWRSR